MPRRKPNLQTTTATTGGAFNERSKRRVRECLRDYGVVTMARLTKVAQGGTATDIAAFLEEEGYSQAGALAALPDPAKANRQRAERLKQGFAMFCAPVPFPA